MSKLKQDFFFNYPLKHKVVRDLKLVTEYVGDLVVMATGTLDSSYSRLDPEERYSVDIDTVSWNGTDIRAVLEVTGTIDEIEEAAVRYFADLVELTQKEVAA